MKSDILWTPELTCCLLNITSEDLAKIVGVDTPVLEEHFVLEEGSPGMTEKASLDLLRLNLFCLHLPTVIEMEMCPDPQGAVEATHEWLTAAREEAPFDGRSPREMLLSEESGIRSDLIDWVAETHYAAGRDGIFDGYGEQEGILPDDPEELDEIAYSDDGSREDSVDADDDWDPQDAIIAEADAERDCEDCNPGSHCTACSVNLAYGAYA